MGGIEFRLGLVFAELMALASESDLGGQGAVHGAAYAAALMLMDAAAEDGVQLPENDALGFMSGSFEG
jgi:hypothetical protein